MDDLQHRLLVSQWIAEEFAGIIDEDRRGETGGLEERIGRQ